MLLVLKMRELASYFHIDRKDLVEKEKLNSQNRAENC